MPIYIVPQFTHIVPEAADHDHQGLGLLIVMLRPGPVAFGHDRPGDDDDQDSDGADDLTYLAQTFHITLWLMSSSSVITHKPVTCRGTKADGARMAASDGVSVSLFP